MKRLLSKLRAIGIIVAFLTGSFSFSTQAAETQLEKKGTYTGHFGTYTIGKTFELEKDHVFWVGEFSGTFFNDAEKGFQA